MQPSAAERQRGQQPDHPLGVAGRAFKQLQLEGYMMGAVVSINDAGWILAEGFHDTEFKKQVLLLKP